MVRFLVKFKKTVTANNFSLVSILLVMLLLTTIPDSSVAQNPVDTLLSKLKMPIADSAKVDVYADLAWELSRSNQEKALEYAFLGLNLAEKISYKKGNCSCLYRIAVLYFQLGEYDNSLGYYKRTLDISQEIGLQRREAYSLMGMGMVYFQRGDYKKSLDYYMQSKKICKAIGDNYGVSYSLSNMAGVYYEQGDYGKSIKNNFDGVAIREKIGDSLGIAYSFANIGEAFYRMEKFDSALHYNNIAIDYFNLLGDKKGVSDCYSTIAHTYQKMKKYDNAYRFYNQSLKIRDSLGFRKETVDSHVSLGKYFLEVGKPNNAKEHFEIAYQDGNRLNLKRTIQSAAKGLSQISEQEGNYELALKYHKVYKAMGDSLWDDDKTRAIARIEMQNALEELNVENEIEKALKEAEYQKNIEQQNYWMAFFIVVLFLLLVLVAVLVIAGRIKQKINIKLASQKREIELHSNNLNKKNEELEQLNATKNKLFSIIAHDLKNPLNSLIGFSKLLLDHYDKISSEKRLDFIQRIYNSATHTNDLLNNLLQWARSQTNSIKPKPEKIGLQSLLSDVLLPLKPIADNKSIKIMLEIRPEKYVFCDRNMFFVVFNNLITNAIKFSKRNDKITITETDDENFCVVSVADNGIGMTEEQIANMFDINKAVYTSGTDKEQGTGLGLIICMEFIRLNNGKIKIKSKPDKGSEFLISLPLFA